MFQESQAGNSGKNRRVTDGTIVLGKVNQFPHWPGRVIFPGPGLQP